MISNLLIACVISLLAAHSGADAKGDQASELLGKEMPELNLLSSDGSAITSRMYDGKARLVVIIAINVPDGTKLFTSLQQLREEYAQEELSMILIELNKKKTDMDLVKKQIDDGMDFYFGKNKELMKHLKMHYIPTVYAVNKDNVITAILQKKALSDHDRLRNAAESALK